MMDTIAEEQDMLKTAFIIGVGIGISLGHSAFAGGLVADTNVVPAPVTLPANPCQHIPWTECGVPPSDGPDTTPQRPVPKRPVTPDPPHPPPVTPDPPHPPPVKEPPPVKKPPEQKPCHVKEC